MTRAGANSSLEQGSGNNAVRMHEKEGRRRGNEADQVETAVVGVHIQSGIVHIGETLTEDGAAGTLTIDATAERAASDEMLTWKTVI